jgi:hypothetical protein
MCMGFNMMAFSSDEQPHLAKVYQALPLKFKMNSKRVPVVAGRRKSEPELLNRFVLVRA